MSGRAVIIALKLPEESHSLADLTSYWAQLVADTDITVTIVTNGPVSRADRQLLQEWSDETSLTQWLCATASSSKAENLNAVLSSSSSELVAVFDADSRPLVDDVLLGFQRLLETTAVLLQGPKLIGLPPHPKLLHRWVSLEQKIHYRSLLPSLANRLDTGYCAGSNFFINRNRLDYELVFPRAISEDIIFSLDLHSKRHRIAFDAEVQCVEAAPLDWGAWARQRRRWVWGWQQAMRYGSRTGAFRKMGPRKAFLWVALSAGPVVGLVLPTALVTAALMGAVNLPSALVCFWAITMLLVMRSHYSGRPTTEDVESVWGVTALAIALYPLYWLALCAVGISTVVPPRRRAVTARAPSSLGTPAPNPHGSDASSREAVG